MNKLLTILALSSAASIAAISYAKADCVQPWAIAPSVIYCAPDVTGFVDSCADNGTCEIRWIEGANRAHMPRKLAAGMTDRERRALGAKTAEEKKARAVVHCETVRYMGVTVENCTTR